jgi:hypothetical protein
MSQTIVLNDMCLSYAPRYANVFVPVRRENVLPRFEIDRYFHQSDICE